MRISLATFRGETSFSDSWKRMLAKSGRTAVHQRRRVKCGNCHPPSTVTLYSGAVHELKLVRRQKGVDHIGWALASIRTESLTFRGPSLSPSSWHGVMVRQGK
jgi:hypothetical protein